MYSSGIDLDLGGAETVMASQSQKGGVCERDLIQIVQGRIVLNPEFEV
jgi:hypothetical protein